MDKGARGELLDRLAGAIGSVTTSHPLRVAVDGPPAAGKITLADEPAIRPRRRQAHCFISDSERARLLDLTFVGWCENLSESGTECQ
jgi:hypothetical protein